MAESAFDGPKSLCRWAGKEIENFKAASAAFFDDEPYKIIEYIDRAADEAVVAVRIIKQPSDDLRRGAYRVVSDLRNALDQAVFAATIALGAVKPKKTAFPFGENAHDFDKALASTRKGSPYWDIPVELHGSLRSYQPFWRVEASDEGNNLLRGLGFIANPNKHHLPMRVSTAPGAWGIQLLNDVALAVTGKWNAAQDEFEIARLTRTGMNPQYKLNVHVFLAFSDAKVLTGKQVVPAFDELLTMVEGIVLGLEAETARIRSLRR